MSCGITSGSFILAGNLPVLLYRQAAILFLKHILHGINLEGEIGYDMLQACILIFQVFHAANFTDFPSAIFGFPVIEGGFANAMFTADVLDGSTRFMRLKNGDYLRLRKPCLFCTVFSRKLENNL